MLLSPVIMLLMGLLQLVARLRWLRREWLVVPLVRRLPSSPVATRLGRLAPLCFHQVVWRLPCSLELARQGRQVPLCQRERWLHLLLRHLPLLALIVPPCADLIFSQICLHRWVQRQHLLWRLLLRAPFMQLSLVTILLMGPLRLVERLRR